jgi:hypothetical protein
MNQMLSVLVLVAAALSAGCGTPKPRLVGDGTTQQFAYRGGVPEPAENDWIVMTVAGTGYSFESKKTDNFPFWWAFAFKAKVDDIASVVVFDVTDAPPELVVRDDHASLKDSTWVGSSATQLLSRATAPWFYEPGRTEHFFKIVLKNSAGEERTLYQPCLHGPEVKRSLLEHIARLTATE